MSDLLAAKRIQQPQNAVLESKRADGRGHQPLPAIVDRMRLRGVIVDRRGSTWAVGTGLIAIGHIDRDLTAHASREAAEATAVALADRLDLLAVRT